MNIPPVISHITSIYNATLATYNTAKSIHSELSKAHLELKNILVVLFFASFVVIFLFLSSYFVHHHFFVSHDRDLKLRIYIFVEDARSEKDIVDEFNSSSKKVVLNTLDEMVASRFVIKIKRDIESARVELFIANKNNAPAGTASQTGANHGR